MNIGIIGGVLTMLTLIVMACGISTFGSFVNIPSIQIVVLGTLAGAVASFPMKTITGLPGAIVKALTVEKYDPITTIKMFTDLAEKSRKEGILALEGPVNKIKDEFLKKGLLLAVDGMDKDLIRDIMETDVNALEDRHKIFIAAFEYMGALAPGMGMLGTVIGLILMLGNLSDPGSLGPAMAVAMITTFYGSIIANCLCNPFASTLAQKNREEVMIKNIMIEGVMMMAVGDNPRIVEQKLTSYLPPADKIKAIKAR